VFLKVREEVVKIFEEGMSLGGGEYLLGSPAGNSGVGSVGITQSSGSGVGVTDGGRGDSGMSIANSSGGGMSDSNGSGVDGGNSVVGLGVSGVVDNGLLNNLVDGVDLVGGGDGDSTGNLDGVWLGNVLLDNDFSLDGDGHLDGHINVVLVDLELRDNVGLDGSDPGVSSHGSKDPLLGDSVSGGGAKVDWCGGDGGVRGGGKGDCGSGQSPGLNNGLGLTGHISMGRLGDDFLVGLDVLVTGLDLLGSNLDGLVTDNTILNMLLHNGGPGSISVVCLSDS
jgi:hypothetical protein